MSFLLNRFRVPFGGVWLALVDEDDGSPLTRVNDSFTVLVFGIKMLAHIRQVADLNTASNRVRHHF